MLENLMKPIFKVSLLAATVLLAVGCQKEESKDAKQQRQQSKLNLQLLQRISTKRMMRKQLMQSAHLLLIT